VVPIFPFALFMLCFIELACKMDEPQVYKNQGREPIHQEYKANESMSRHNPKKKQKQTINKKIRKKPYANRTHGNKMPINDNKEDLT
jgi:hypothetical protein